MESYSIRDARDHLETLIEDARQGKTVLILDEHEHAVRLVPVAVTSKPRKGGSARGQIKMAEDFDAPLADFDDYME